MTKQTTKTDWLNGFVEKNAWGMLLALTMVTIAYTVLKTKVEANEAKIKTIEQAQIVMVETQKAIIELQVKQANVEDDVTEIKQDVKKLLNRD